MASFDSNNNYEVMGKHHKIWANFSVKNAEATDRFYKALGFTSNGFDEQLKLTSFRFGEDDFIIHFFQQGSQIDEFLKPTDHAAGEIIFTLSEETEQGVWDFAEKVKQAGGSILKEVKRDEAGYFGFAFADPDGHKFNMLLMDNM